MSFPRYPAYKDSGVEWLGEVPAHWDLLPLKRRIARIESGTSVNAVDTPASEGEYGVLKTSCVYSGEFRPDENKAVLPEEYERVACPLLAGTLIVSRMNTPDLVGAAGLVREAREGIFLPDRLWQIQLSALDPSFVHRWTQSDLYRAQVQMACSGTSASMQNLAQDQFGSFLLPTPPAAEQHAISIFLDRETAKIDALIAEQERLIDLLKEKRQAVISHAVTKGLDPNVPMKDSGVEWLGQVPAHWVIRPLKHVTALRSGGTPSKDNLDFWNGRIPWASAKDLKQERLGDTEDHITDAAIEAGAAELVPAGAVLVVVRGMILARTFPVTLATVPMAINQDLKAIVPFGNVSSAYLARALQAAAEESTRRIDEAGHGTKALRMDAWTSLPLPVPPVDEQQAIATFLDRETAMIDALLAEQERGISLLSERRAALISAAVTGQIDVRAIARA